MALLWDDLATTPTESMLAEQLNAITDPFKLLHLLPYGDSPKLSS